MLRAESSRWTRLGGISRLATALVAVALGALLFQASASAATRRAVQILAPDATTPITHGGSSTPFLVAVPNGAACPGDTAHRGFIVDTYVLPESIDPSSVSFAGGAPKQGSDLVSAGLEPFEARNTIENTGAVPPLPTFSWAAYVGHPDALSAKVYNFGVMCANELGAATTYWNAKAEFTPTSADPGGFTWTILGSPKASSGRLRAAPLAGFMLALAVIGGGVVLLRRRPGSAKNRVRKSDLGATR